MEIAQIHESLRVNYQEYAPAWGKTCISGNNRRFAVHPKDLLTGYQVMKKGYRTPVREEKRLP
jgi:hypothetical protein